MAQKRNAINKCDALIKRCINELINEVGNSLSTDELDCRLEIVETYFARALEHQSEIEQMDNDAENANASEVRAYLEELYCNVKVNIRSLMKRKANKPQPEKASELSSSKLSDNLPKLKLPNFGGKYSEYPNFNRLFRTLVHNEDKLSTIEKFNHLLSCLSGSALQIVKTLDVVEKNFETALAMLDFRFCNKFLICQEHIKELSHLPKVQKASSEQLRFLVDTVSARYNALMSLLTHEEISNALLLQLVMTALDNESLEKIEESIDSSKTLSWSDCATVLTQRCQMLESREFKISKNDQSQFRQTAGKSLNKQQKSITLTSTSRNYCSCCKQHITHPLWKCSKFMQLSPLQRFEHTTTVSTSTATTNQSTNFSTKQYRQHSKCLGCNLKGHQALL